MNFDESTKGKRWEVVGAWIQGKYVSSEREAILWALEHNLVSAWITRHEAVMMEWADLGAKWAPMAKGKALFVVNEDGVPEMAGGQNDD